MDILFLIWIMSLASIHGWLGAIRLLILGGFHF